MFASDPKTRGEPRRGGSVDERQRLQAQLLDAGVRQEEECVVKQRGEPEIEVGFSCNPAEAGYQTGARCRRRFKISRVWHPWLQTVLAHRCMTPSCDCKQSGQTRIGPLRLFTRGHVQLTLNAGICVFVCVRARACACACACACARVRACACVSSRTLALQSAGLKLIRSPISCSWREEPTLHPLNAREESSGLSCLAGT